MVTRLIAKGQSQCQRFTLVSPAGQSHGGLRRCSRRSTVRQRGIYPRTNREFHLRIAPRRFMFHAFILRSEMFRTGGETFYAEFNLSRILAQVVDARQ